MFSMPLPAPEHIHDRRARESGSVMIYIFLGIALFAALSYAVANIMSSGSADPKRETRMLDATDVIQYADGLKRAVQGMRIRNITDQQISFETPRTSIDYAHPVTAPQRCTSDNCRVFAAIGGGFTYIDPPGSWLDSQGAGDSSFGQWFFPRGVCVEDAGQGGAACHTDGEDNEDLVAVLPWVKRELCIDINERLGITNPAGQPPVAAGNAWVSGNLPFVGTYVASAVIARGGQTAGCLRGAGVPPSDSYFYYKVLLAR